jgi:hypothetical protein
VVPPTCEPPATMTRKHMRHRRRCHSRSTSTQNETSQSVALNGRITDSHWLRGEPFAQP